MSRRGSDMFGGANLPTSPGGGNMGNRPVWQALLLNKVTAWLAGILVGWFIIFQMFNLDEMFGYLLYQVKDNEVGIRFNANRPYEVVGSGAYQKFGLFETMRSIKSEGLPFSAQDDEVLTRDSQRLGVVVAGTVHRPGVEKADILLQNWSTYGSFYQNDAALTRMVVEDRGKEGKREVPAGLMQDLGRQAMKVCVGDRVFEKVAIGSARDELRECVDLELDKLVKGYGLEVRNVTVPNVILSPEVQKRLDEITQSRLATQLADQQKLQAEADAKRLLAVEKGKIEVEQGRVQEKARQDAITVSLEKQVQDARTELINVLKSNELLEANKNFDIAKVTRTVSEENAKANLAPKLAEAAMYQTNPVFADLAKTQSIASAYGQTDKILMLPQGTNPMVFIGGQDLPVTIPTQQPAR